MSRIGKKPVQIPAGVQVTVTGNHVDVKGPKGSLYYDFHDMIDVAVEGDQVIVTRKDDERESRAMHGLTRALIQNMVIGVSEGYSKTLELYGVGYRAALKGGRLELQLGYSHPVYVDPLDGITLEVPDNTHIVVKGIDKQKVGQMAAQIRSLKPVEPYKGKGIHYEGEQYRRKLGKAAK